MNEFSATLKIIGVNPYVEVPPQILKQLLNDANKTAGPVPIHGTVNGLAFTQTLVKFQGKWRLYINMKMLKNSPQRVGETLHISVAVDTRPRTIAIHPMLKKALSEHPEAQKVFDELTPSLQHEIKRYISRLKTEDSVQHNVERAIGFLLGRNSFVGRKSVK